MAFSKRKRNIAMQIFCCIFHNCWIFPGIFSLSHSFGKFKTFGNQVLIILFSDIAMMSSIAGLPPLPKSLSGLLNLPEANSR